jgi:glutaminase
MSVSRPFMFALVCHWTGPIGARERLGVNATGHAFNSLAGLGREPDGRTNPMGNAGAIAATSLAPGARLEERWDFIRAGMSRFAGRDLTLNAEVYESAAKTNFRDRGLVWLLESTGRVFCDPPEAMELYTRQCSLDVTARDLAVMARRWRTAASMR